MRYLTLILTTPWQHNKVPLISIINMEPEILGSNADMKKEKKKRLTFSQRAEIKDRLDSGEKEVDLAREFGVSQGAILNTKLRKECILSIVNTIDEQDIAIIDDRQSGSELCGKVFANDFLRSIENKQYDHEYIYNADEMGLIWKSLPTRTSITEDEKSTLGQNVVKDRITVIVCSNAAGTHKIPLLIIGKTKNPRCFKTNKILPVLYKSQHNGRMDSTIFKEWYEQIFIPEISKKHGSNAKCILLIDTAPSHPPAEKLNVLSKVCTVKCLPPNITEQIHPMNRGVIERIRKIYKRCFLEHLLLTQNVEETETSLKNWNLLMCGNILAYAWDRVTEINLQCAWNNLFKKSVIENVSDQTDTEDCVRLLRQVCSDNNITTECATRWLQDACDSPLAHDKYESHESTKKSDQVGAGEALILLDRFQKFYQTCAGCTVDDVLNIKRFRAIVINSIVCDK